MFEPLDEKQTDRQGSGRAMRIIGIVIAILAVVLLVISFA